MCTDEDCLTEFEKIVFLSGYFLSHVRSRLPEMELIKVPTNKTARRIICNDDRLALYQFPKIFIDIGETKTLNNSR